MLKGAELEEVLGKIEFINAKNKADALVIALKKDKRLLQDSMKIRAQEIYARTKCFVNFRNRSQIKDIQLPELVRFLKGTNKLRHAIKAIFSAMGNPANKAHILIKHLNDQICGICRADKGEEMICRCIY